MVAAQIKKKPLNGPTARKVATPARMPMLKESAVRLFMDLSPKVASLQLLNSGACPEKIHLQDGGSLERNRPIVVLPWFAVTGADSFVVSQRQAYVG